MSSSDQTTGRRALLGLLAPALLAACGFAPVYGSGGPARALLNRVRIEDPTNKNAFDLVERLEERLGRPQNVAFRLSYGITTQSRGLGITPDNTTTRYNIDGTVTYTLSDAVSGTPLAQGEVTTFVSYSASGSTVATVAAEEDAYARLMRLLADQIVSELIASSAGWSVR
ncbi:MAG: hypothetical protein H5U17_11625 [Defluviimonas sp.]|nr:hypothetical protein [Defluviimonas sp.]